MNKQELIIAAILPILSFAFFSSPAAAFSSSSINAAPNFPVSLTLSFVDSPTQIELGLYSAVNVTLESNYGWSLSVVVFSVVQNALGQTVAISTCSVTFAPYATESAYVVVFGIAFGNYNATEFALASSGVAISVTMTVPIAFTQS